MSDVMEFSNLIITSWDARGDSDKGSGSDVLGLNEEAFGQTRKRELLRCRICGNIVSSLDQKISVNGMHLHTFFNPHGIVFELGCFREAKGCLNYGVLTAEFTWFPGFSWVFSSCLECGEHLGWFYRCVDGEGFYGLIISKLRQEIG